MRRASGLAQLSQGLLRGEIHRIGTPHVDDAVGRRSQLVLHDEHVLARGQAIGGHAQDGMIDACRTLASGQRREVEREAVARLVRFAADDGVEPLHGIARLAEQAGPMKRRGREAAVRKRGIPLPFPPRRRVEDRQAFDAHFVNPRGRCHAVLDAGLENAREVAHGAPHDLAQRAVRGIAVDGAAVHAEPVIRVVEVQRVQRGRRRDRSVPPREDFTLRPDQHRPMSLPGLDIGRA